MSKLFNDETLDAIGHAVNVLQGMLKFGVDATLAKANYDRIKTILTAYERQVATLRALLAANRQLCPHINRRSTYDGWDCPDCGEVT